MTLLWLEGFDQFQNGTDMQPMYGTQGTGNINEVVGRDSPVPSGNALDIAAGTNRIWVPLLGIDEDTTITVGFAHFFGSNLNHTIFQIQGTDGTEMRIRYETTGGEIAVDRNVTELGVSSGLGLVINTWYYIEWQFRIHNTLGTYEVRVDEVNVVSDTGVDTRNSSAHAVLLGAINLLGTASIANNHWDDLYVLDDNGLVNNDFLGDTTIETLFPKGDGFVNDFTPQSGLTNWEMVDDGDTPDNGTTYNAGSVVDDIDLFDCDDLVITGETIHGVMVGFNAFAAEPGPRQMRSMVRQGGTNYEGDIRYLGPEYRHFHFIHETDPDTAAAWTDAGIDSAEFGYTIES